MHSRPGTLLAMFVLSIAGALLAVSAAFAHAEPVTVAPGSGAVVTAAPPEIVIQMSQEMARREGANDIDVVDAAGIEVTTLAAVIDNGDRSRLSVLLPSDLPPGVYTVRWMTLSAEDGDTANGEYSFTLDPEGTATAGQETLREDLLGDAATPETSSPLLIGGGGDDGVPWMLLVATATGMFVLGAGSTFLLIQKRP